MDPALANSLDNLLPRIGMKWDSVSRTKPWMLALRLSVADFKLSGLDTSWSNEEYIAGFARAQNKPVEGFETIMEQMQVFDAAPLPEQYAYLRNIIGDIVTAPATGRKNRLALAWLAGDAIGIEDAYQRARTQLELTLPAPCWYGCGRMLTPDGDWVAAHVIDANPTAGWVASCRWCDGDSVRSRSLPRTRTVGGTSSVRSPEQG
jgi:hypothetical protein